MPTIEVKNLSKSFQDSIAIKDITFQVEEGTLVTLLGPSGSGKTTILRLIAGLIEPDTGQIFFDKENISSVPTEERNIGFVFQSYALFPHLNVIENIAFGLEARKWAKKDIINRVKEMLKLVALEGKGNRYPRELSGGEKSRVALARALAPKPTLLLLDEPLSALDKSLKENLRLIIRDIQQKIHLSTIYVTHDQTEAMEISDLIIILNNGSIVEIGPPQELYLRPKKKFTAEFLGITNILSGKVIKKEEKNYLENPIGLIELPSNKIPSRKNLSIAIFPEHITISKISQNKINEFPAEIVECRFGGSRINLIIRIKNFKIKVQAFSEQENREYYKGDQIFFSIPLHSFVFLDE